MGGTLTGRDGNFVIIDDPIKPEDAMSDIRRSAVNERFDRTLYSRLDDKRNDVIILIMQRLRIDDLTGHVLGKEHWVHLNLPAIAETERSIPIAADRLYLRSRGTFFTDRGSRKVTWTVSRRRSVPLTSPLSISNSQSPLKARSLSGNGFQFYDQLQPRNGHDKIVHSWDVASKVGEFNDWYHLVRSRRRFLPH